MTDLNTTFALEFVSVTKVFSTSRGDKVALDALDLRLAPGSLTALVGRSGCGKTTALNIASGLIEPTSGRVNVQGRDVAQLHFAEGQKFLQKTLGRVFQHFDLFDELTVLENVMLPCELAGQSRTQSAEVAAELIHRFGLSDISSERAGHISGGEKQRTAIARALTLGPQILLADEPTGNLDRENAEMVASALIAASKAGACVLVATHDPIVRDVCSHVVDLGRRSS
jgi:ABC-type branched-subunit amino acid transport system ATPase component